MKRYAVLLPTLDFTERTTGSFASFYYGSREVRVTQFTVPAKETVTVPAGTFEAYKLILTLPSKDTLAVFVTVAEPRHTVLIRGENGATEIRLVKRQAL